MKKLLENISRSIGITKTELTTFIFVLAAFVSGLIANYRKNSISENPVKRFEYSFQDSLFKALNKKSKEHSVSLKKKEKKVDSEVELLDFSKEKLDSKKNNALQLRQHSININTADEETLTKIPGIGRTIAKRIIELRIRKGNYKNLDELIEVKRIGLKKLKKIKKFIYLEKQMNP